MTAAVAFVLCVFPVAESAGYRRDWNLRSTNGPAIKSQNAAAYNSRRGVVVLFGGPVVSGQPGETWEWSGHEWVLRSSTGPESRGAHALAYDAKNDLCVLYGGGSGSHLFDDTWTWDGNTWSEYIGLTPPARSLHPLVYYPRDESIILYGGSKGRFVTDYKDMWRWNGQRWSQMPDGPGVRTRHLMIYHASRDSLFMVDLHHFNQDDHTWEWAGQWTNLHPPTTPLAMSEWAMDYDSRRDLVIGYSKFDTYVITWTWNGADWRDERQTGPDLNDVLLLFDSRRSVPVLIGRDGTATHTYEYGCAIGDRNCDGWISLEDYYTRYTGGIYHSLSGPTIDERGDRSDFNLDGFVDMRDVALYQSAMDPKLKP